MAYLILDLLPVDVPLHQIEQLQRVVETEVAEGIEALPDLLVGHVPGVDEPRDDLGVADGRPGVGQHVEELAGGNAFGAEGGWKEKEGGGVEKRYASFFEFCEFCIFSNIYLRVDVFRCLACLNRESKEKLSSIGEAR